MGEMMTTEMRKLDAPLLNLVKAPLARDERYPVFVNPLPDCFEAVREAVERLEGTVRHLLPELNTISASLTLSAIEAIAALAEVEDVELCQPTDIAAALH